MQVQRPAPVAKNPDRGDIRFAGHGVGTARSCLCVLIHHRSDASGEERDPRINNLGGAESTLRMELLDGVEDPIQVRYLLFDASELCSEQFRELRSAPVPICLPERVSCVMIAFGVLVV